MTRLVKGDFPEARLKHWETGFDRRHSDAVAGRPAELQPTWGYEAGYGAHTSGECPCYKTKPGRLATASISLKGTTYTMNRALRSHWRENSRLTAAVRDYAAKLWAAELKGQQLATPVKIYARQMLVAGRKPQDIGAQFPTAKAALDGLVDAGGIPDDSPDFVREITFLAHATKPGPPGEVLVTAVALGEVSPRIKGAGGEGADRQVVGHDNERSNI